MIADHRSIEYRLPPLEIVPLGAHAPPSGILQDLADDLRHVLGISVVISEPRQFQTGADGGTLSSNAIIDQLVAEVGDRTAEQWVTVITNADLVAPGRTFVFGEATLGGPFAIVSTAHFHDRDSPHLLRERLLKETIHELGHLARLDHCADSSCVMSISSDVTAIDRKQTDFCNICRELFRGMRAT